MNRAIKHICLDKDGTLIDVHSYWTHNSQLRARSILAKFELSEALLGELLEAMGIDSKCFAIKKHGPVGYYPRAVIVRSVLDFLENQGLAVEAHQIEAIFKEIDLYQQEYNDYSINLLPGTLEFLTAARNARVSLSIFSSDRKANIARILSNHGLDSFFHSVVGGDSVTHSKPHPEGFLLACELVNVSASESCYVGDTIEDLKMAIEGRAGLAIGVECGLATRSDLLSYTQTVFRDLGHFDFRALDL